MRLPPRNALPGALAVAVSLAVVSVPSPASAAGSGGTTAPVPTAGTPTTPAAPAAPTGGTTPGSSTPSGRKRKRSVPRPVLVTFEANARRFYDLGRPARITFRIDGRSRTVRVKLQVRSAGRVIRTLDLGDRATKTTHSYSLTGSEGGRLPEGTLQLRLAARDPRGRGLHASSRASTTDSLEFYWHHFPLAGPFTYGLGDGRFGAPRPGRLHQGQDLLAASGTPVVAPRGGVVKTVAYQAGGAGHYIVLRAEGEDRSYVFMHLLDGSVHVRPGDPVRTGQRLADVGSTGSSTGPHLHFEVWVGEWFGGGHAIDPLPDLQRWDAWS